SGILPHLAVFVVANSSAALPGVTPHMTTGSLTFNGDDALALWKVSTGSYVDIFGSIGHDPGTEWGSGLLSTADNTLRRKSSVMGGVTTNPGSGFPTLATEWDGFATDTGNGLGSHDFDGVDPSI